MNAPGKHMEMALLYKSVLLAEHQPDLKIEVWGLGDYTVWCAGKCGLSITALQYYLLSKLSVRSRKSLSGSAISLYKALNKSTSVLIGKLKPYLLFKHWLPSTRMPTLFQPIQLIFSCRAHRH